MTERAERLLKLAEELGLTEIQRRFSLAYKTNGGNGTQAAMEAGSEHGSAHVAASRMLKLDKVQTYMLAIDEAAGEGRRVERKIATREEILARMSDRALFDAQDFVTLTPEGGFSIDLERAFKAGKGHMIKELRHDPETGAPIIKWADPDVSLDRLAKMYGIYKDEDGAPKTSVTIGQVLVQVIGDGRAPDSLTLAATARKMLSAGDVVEAEPA